MDKLSDEQLFSRLLQGDGESLRPLLVKYSDALMLFINSYIHDLDMAEELMMEAFSRMLARRPIFMGKGFKSYLYKTGRNLAIEYLKTQSRFVSLDELPEEPAEARRVEDNLLADERNRELYHCLSQIPADYREALYLVYIEGMSHEDAAAIMRKSRKQVSNLVQRGKAAMRAKMSADPSGKKPDQGNRAASRGSEGLANQGVYPLVLEGESEA